MERQDLEEEITAAKQVIKTSKKIIAITEITLSAFETALEQMPEKEKDLNTNSSIG